jgi:predicted ATPase
VVVSHAAPLIDALQQRPECHSLMLDKRLGETTLLGADDSTPPTWHWPAR